MMKKTFVILLLVTVISNTQASKVGKVLNALTKIPFLGRGIEDLGNRYAHTQIDRRVKELHRKALTCNPLETDHESMMDVRDWMNIRPVNIDWRAADRLTPILNEAKAYAATKPGTDKNQHCYAGCFIRKKIDFKTAQLSAWLKELSDSSDCNPNSHFEKADYESTVAGAVAGTADKDCDLFCGDPIVMEMSGSQMLEYSYEYVKNSESE